MRVLVTGHDGYIGTVLVPVLVEAGHRVTGLDAFLYEGCELFPPPAEVEAVRLDVRDVQPDDLAGFDAIVHLAALSNDPLGALAPELTREVNLGATVALARSAKEAGVGRFVFASSCSMYGTADAETPVAEDAPLRPLSAYAESKVRAEEALAGLADGDFAPVLMRNATAYGASPRMRVDLVLNNLVGWALTTGRIRILSDGTPWRPLVHVEDIARATLAALEAPRGVVAGEAFNVGRDQENYQVRELAELVRAAVPGCEIEYAGSGEPDPRSYRVDFGKLRRTFPALELAWTAARGAVEMRDALRDGDLTREAFEGPRYTRLKRLEALLAEGRLDDRLRRREAA
ncbi:MAG TPA: SDR family oxidoreductase [Gaiellaceae bacterium]|nr:SDR family oxidoreductase [Gaiellaceae bacterium]